MAHSAWRTAYQGGSQRYYIQAAYDMTSEEKQAQELNSLRNITDSFKKIMKQRDEPLVKYSVRMVGKNDRK